MEVEIGKFIECLKSENENFRSEITPSQLIRIVFSQLIFYAIQLKTGFCDEKETASELKNIENMIIDNLSKVK